MRLNPPAPLTISHPPKAILLNPLCHPSLRLRLKSLVLPLLASLLMPSSPALAAEQITIQLGPLKPTVTTQEVENFIQTGQVPPPLAPFALLVPTELIPSLQMGLQLNPDISHPALDQMLLAPMGKRLVKVIALILPEVSPEQILSGMKTARNLPQGLNLINFIRALPPRSITININALLDVIAQFKLYYQKSRDLGPQLAADLYVPQASWTPALEPAAAGKNFVREQSQTIIDQARKRTLFVDIYWSQKTQADAPLVVMIHGLGGNKNALAYLARHLTSHGMTVVTLKHPDNAALERDGNQFTLGGELYLPAQEFLERPKDVSFLLDQLAQLNLQPGLWQGKFNTKSVTVAGSSLGGTTGLTLAGAEFDLESLRATCKAIDPIGRDLADWTLCNATVLPGRYHRIRDRRIAQVIAINPVVGDLFGSLGLSNVETPVLMISSTEDVISPAITNHLEPFRKLPTPKYLLTAIGATHLSFNDLENVQGNKRFRVVQENVGRQNKTLQQLLRGVSLAFTQQLTSEAEKYRPFLTPAYAQSLSTESMPLRLNGDLPQSIVRVMDQKLAEARQFSSQR
jgi:predicted dienelactone hydrolase